MNRNLLSTGDPDVIALVRQLNDDFSDPHHLSFNSKLWCALTDAELHLIGLPASSGGAGGSLTDLVATVFECARAGAAVPLAENHIAQHLRVGAGLDVAPGISICATATSQNQTSLFLEGLTWALQSDELIVLDVNATTPTARAAHSWNNNGSNSLDLAGQPAQDVEILQSHLNDSPVLSVDREQHNNITKLVRAAQISGAIRGCYDLSQKFAAERHQFGVRIDSFPAVQLHLIQLAQAAAITRVSVFRAAAAVEEGRAARGATTYTMSICDRFAREAIRCAHQLHGAIGVTREYHLASLTRRLHWWRLTDTDLPEEKVVARSIFHDQMWLVEESHT
jgi:acyl-CoA dehydrogenase